MTQPADVSCKGSFGTWGDELTLTGVTSGQEQRLDEAARSGAPIRFVVQLDGVEYHSKVVVTRRGPGQYDMQPVTRMRRRLAALALNPTRLPL